MHFVYGLANGNALAAKRIYEQRYPNRVVPSARMFTSLHRRLSETGSFKKQTADNERPRTVSTPQVEEEVLDEIGEYPSRSTRKIAANLNISHATVFRILKRQLLYPYHIQRVQGLLPGDYPQRVAFCQWVLERNVQNPQFLGNILFTDEANFSRDAIMNFHNNHIWAEDNPYEILESRHQHTFSVNVWAGIIGDHLIGPFFLPRRLTGETYHNFLQNELPILLEDVPVQLRRQMYFMHDGAPPHFSLLARQCLDASYPRRWIGRRGPQHWPARSPDLNALDFFFGVI